MNNYTIIIYKLSLELGRRYINCQPRHSIRLRPLSFQSLVLFVLENFRLYSSIYPYAQNDNFIYYRRQNEKK